MASRFPIPSPSIPPRPPIPPRPRPRPEKHEESLCDIRIRIHSKFDLLHKLLDNRKRFLLKMLAEFESTHNEASKQQQTSIARTIKVQSQVMEGLNDNILKPLQETLLDGIQTQIEQMEISVNLNKINFEFDDDDAKNFISSLGKVSKVPNYKVKKHPIIVSTAKHGGSHVPGEFHGPSVLTIGPNSGDIYIGCCDGMIHVFSPDAEFIRAIDTKTGSAILGIAFNNSAIFVAFANCDLRQYHLNGACIKTITTPKKYGETRALTILNSNLLLIPLLSENPIGCINLDTMAIEPVILEKIDSTGSSVGIKSTPKGDLAILYSSTPFVVVFNIQGKILSKPLRRSVHLKSPEYFAIDSCDHFIISDDYIKIFQSNGELLHTIGGPSHPDLISLSLGIDIDSQGRIVNICGKKTNCLQVF